MSNLLTCYSPIDGSIVATRQALKIHEAREKIIEAKRVDS